MAKTLLPSISLLGATVITMFIVGSQGGHGKTEVDHQSTLQLLPLQIEVWNEEQNYFRYLQAKDLKSYMSLWDTNFVGWPDCHEHPVRKADIESDVAEEFRTAKLHAPPLPFPKPESIVIFGDIAITYYFWPEVDGASAPKYRITHTWRKGPGGWRIIAGMSCAVPRSSAGIRPVGPEPISQIRPSKRAYDSQCPGTPAKTLDSPKVPIP